MDDCCWAAEAFTAALPDFESSHAEDVQSVRRCPLRARMFLHYANGYPREAGDDHRHAA
jgi:hypothetical protein